MSNLHQAQSAVRVQLKLSKQTAYSIKTGQKETSDVKKRKKKRKKKKKENAVDGRVKEQGPHIK